MSKFLVTGGCGFIGSNLVRQILKDGNEVVVLDNLATGFVHNVQDVRANITLVEGDVRDFDTLRDVLQGVDFVFHEAAMVSVFRSVANPRGACEHNILGTVNVLTAARDAKVKRVVMASSSSVYGNTEVLPKVETMPSTPLSPYALTKYVDELYCNQFFDLYGLETVALRYFNVFGPHQDPNSDYAAVIPKFITCLLDGNNPTIYGDGEQTRDFTYIDNVVSANFGAMKAPADKVAGRAFNVGNGERTSLNQLLSALSKILGRKSHPVYAETRVGDVRDSLADISRAKEAFGYTPAVDLVEGLQHTAEWFRSTR